MLSHVHSVLQFYFVFIVCLLYNVLFQIHYIPNFPTYTADFNTLFCRIPLILNIEHKCLILQKILMLWFILVEYAIKFKVPSQVSLNIETFNI